MKTPKPEILKKSFSNIVYPTNTFRAVNYKPGVTCMDGSPVPQHEKVHTVINHQQSGLYIGILSSCDGTKKGFNCIKLGAVKYNKSFTPIINKNTKLPFLGADGNAIPNPKKGGQFCIFFDSPKIVPEEGIVENNVATEFLKPHQEMLNKAFINFRIGEKTPVGRKYSQTWEKQKCTKNPKNDDFNEDL